MQRVSAEGRQRDKLFNALSYADANCRGGDNAAADDENLDVLAWLPSRDVVRRAAYTLFVNICDTAQVCSDGISWDLKL